MAALTYKKAGVDIDKADVFVKSIRPLIRRTGRPEVLGKLGGFSGFFQPRFKGIADPVLVAATDGVGTKLLVAETAGKFDTIGIDLVAMCVNDIVVSGAEPLFFLDYLAVGKLVPEKLREIVKGISAGCRKAGCALIGGETAELPGLYEKEKFDLAGFCVGMVSRKKIIDGRGCRQGNVAIGLASSGLHSNGYSLVRKLFDQEELTGKMLQELLRPTRIYVKSVLKVLKKVPVKAAAHITGGGIFDNIPRVLPKNADVIINNGTWPVPPIFEEIQRRSGLDKKEMFRTFNMGIGMTLIVDKKDANLTLGLLKAARQKAWIIGDVVRGSNSVMIKD
jgi:phosphoribosylformylglycinamidine cyclo-ligase